MKKYLLIFAASYLLSGCGTGNEQSSSTPVWVATDISFTSTANYAKPFDDVTCDVIFTGPDGRELKLPAFWDGHNLWKARFAPTREGIWTYLTICSDAANQGLHGRKGRVKATAYTGDVAIYRHGFVKTEPNIRYFMYADGTPFFYLGDTHWNMCAELLDSSDVREIPSHFKYIVDKRVEQGFTVYQSEPIAAKYNLADGVTEADMAGFHDMEARFKYIAEKGLVHANAQFFFAAEIARHEYSPEYLAKLARNWVARFSAYPVMWTTAQECDDDFYHGRLNEKGEDSNPHFDAQTNPWKIVAAKMHEYDPYKHPLTGHQEFSSMDQKNGGINASQSSFRDIPGHNWYAAQTTPPNNKQLDFAIAKDFWYNGQGKVIVNYEGAYDHLWTLEFGARQQGWLAYLNGMFGQGYGAIDIWLFRSKYDMEKPSVRGDVTITLEDKRVKWWDSVHFPAATQLGVHMQRFFKTFAWWKLQPCFDDQKYLSAPSAWYSGATIGNDTYVVYFYNKTTDTGTLNSMEPGKTYRAQWFNPRTGEYVEITKALTPDVDSSWKMPAKPDGQDWVILVTKSTA